MKILFFVSLFLSAVLLLAGELNVPAALNFVEPLLDSLKPEDIVVFSGCESYARRTSDFGRITSSFLADFANFHGYRHVFLDELPNAGNCVHQGHRFALQWLRVFALPELRRAFPDAKYYVWMDDDVLIPYKETHMLNHYINRMETDPEVYIMVGGEDEPYVMNTGVLFMRNTDDMFDAWKECLDVGLENNALLARNPIHEQGALILVMRRRGWEGTKIKAILHREGMYNFNTWYVDTEAHHWPGTKAVQGDAFVHFIGVPFKDRARLMAGWLRPLFLWRNSVPEDIKLPIDMQ